MDSSASTRVSSASRRLAPDNPWLLFSVGFLIRVLYITLAHTYRIRVLQDHFQLGWEMGRVARALVTGYGYADPFIGHTGPTAWVPPLYPLLMAAVFKVAGVYTATSAWILLTLNSIFSAATALFVYEIGARCYNRKVAVWSAWLWALYPAAMQYSVHWIWEMSLTTFLFTWTLALALKMRGISPRGQDIHDEPQNPGQWLLFGALWGLIALSNSTLLLFLPACGVWILLGTRPFGSEIRNAVFAALVFIALVAPWTVRNFRVFHTFIPMRDNLGAELEASSGPGSNGFPVMATLPIVEHEKHIEHYKSVGELRYVQEQGALAKQYIAAHRLHYALLSLKRFYFFWVSVPHEGNAAGEFFRELSYCFLSVTGILGLALSLRNRTPAAWLFTWAFLLLPFTYYLVTANARFRHPLEPLIAILTVYLFQSTGPRTPKYREA